MNSPAPKKPEPPKKPDFERSLARLEEVVRRLESLGPDQLEAVRRYEASTRNRRTILNRAGQLLDEQSSEPSDG